MPALNPTRQNALLLAILLFAQLLLIAGSVSGEQGASYLEMGALSVTRPIVGAAGAVGGAVRSGAEGLGELWRAREENHRLRAELEQARGEMRGYREAALQNERLRRLLGMRAGLVPESVGASVISATLTAQDRLVIIDRGIGDGVRADLPVVAWGGAVGRVVSAGPGVAKVRLITDPNSGIAGIVQRTRVEGSVIGAGGDRMELRYVPRYDDVMLGDRVVTSGLEGVFPRGVGLGRVVFVGEDRTGVSKVIRLRPEVDFSKLEEVLVLLEPVGGDLLDTLGEGQTP